MKPVVVDAAEVRALARRRNQKSDYRDAWELADGIRRDLYRKIVYIPDAKIETLRRILSRRRHFMAQRTRAVNAARFLLRTSGRSNLKFTLVSERSWQQMLSHPELEELRRYLELHYQTWALTVSIINQLEEYLRQALEPFEQEVELLRSVPGVGLLTASAMIAAVATPDRFPSPAHLASYLGLVPSTYDSGGREVRGHITKAGPPYIRGLLCEGAQQARRIGHPLNPLWRKVCARGGYNKAIVAVAHRLVRIMFAMWRDGRRFDPGKYPAVKTTGGTNKQNKVYRLQKSA